MAAPFPPAGNQTIHTEKPRQVYAEQYVDGAPLPVGAVIDPIAEDETIPMFTDGLPRVLVPQGWIVLVLTDWVISSRYSGRVIEVVDHGEFTERYAGPGL